MNQIRQVTDCIFCQVAIGKAPCFKVFEDQNNLGFLDIFPNTEGFSVLITKQHYASDFAQAPFDVVVDLLKASRMLAEKIVKAYTDVGRCAIVMEGMMIDHLHAKLIPLHKTAGRKPTSEDGAAEFIKGDEYLTVYPGYITTKTTDQMADKDYLAQVAEKINKTIIK